LSDFQHFSDQLEHSNALAGDDKREREGERDFFNRKLVISSKEIGGGG
jgi:hypothetical protein